MRFLLCLLPFLAAAQTPDATDLIERADGAFFSAPTRHLAGTRFEEILVPVTRPPVKSTFRVDMADNGRLYHSTVISGDDTQTEIANGETVWRYSSRTNQISQLPWTPNGASSRELLLLLAGREPAAIENATIEREESIDFAGQPTLCYVVKAEYSDVPWAPRFNNAERIVWIAKDTELILRDQWEVNSINWGRREIIEYSEIEHDKPMDPKLFVFSPPAGTTSRGF